MRAPNGTTFPARDCRRASSSDDASGSSSGAQKVPRATSAPHRGRGSDDDSRAQAGCIHRPVPALEMRELPTEDTTVPGLSPGGRAADRAARGISWRTCYSAPRRPRPISWVRRERRPPRSHYLPGEGQGRHPPWSGASSGTWNSALLAPPGAHGRGALLRDAYLAYAAHDAIAAPTALP
jgi:hypothetical protein